MTRARLERNRTKGTNTIRSVADYLRALETIDADESGAGNEWTVLENDRWRRKRGTLPQHWPEGWQP